MTWTNPDEHVSKLRAKLEKILPGAATIQSKIIHTTLFHILTPKQLPMDVIQKIDQACQDATAQVSPVNVTWLLA